MQSNFIGGLDIGGTKMAAVVAGAEGPLARVTALTAKTGTERAVGEQGIALLKAACDKAGVDFQRIDTVGVSSCGPFEKRHGLVELVTPNICGGLASNRGELPNQWQRVPLGSVLHEQFKTVEIENDCVAALTAERAFGAAQGMDHCAYVTWSTGIGFGLCVDGHVLRGKHGNAGHAGHMLMSEHSDALCGCGNRGDLESLVSGRNLELRFGQPARALFAAAAAGDATERVLIAQAASWFGRGLYNLVAALDLHRFVIGGSVWTYHADWLAPLVQKEIDGHFPTLTQGVSVVPAALGALVADIGAFCLVMPPEWTAAWRQTRPWQSWPALAG